MTNRRYPNVVRMPKPVTTQMVVFVCYECDMYFHVGRGIHYSKIRCPVIGCRSKEKPECLGTGSIELAMQDVKGMKTE